MKELIETKIFKISLEKESETLTFKEIEILLDDFADSVLHLIKTDNCNENILRTLSYTKIRLYTLKSFVGKAKKKCLHL